MKFISARQAIHDAYATNLTSKGFEVNLVALSCSPDFSQHLQSIHRRKQQHREKLLAEFNPVGFYSEDRIGKDCNNHRICHNVEAGKVISVVESLDEPFRSWAKWAYGPRTQEYLREQRTFFQWLDNDITENFSSIDRKYREVTKQKIRDVVAYCVMDYRSYIISGKHLYPVPLIINRCGIIRQNWKRDFESWHRYYWDLCDEYLDPGCLLALGAVLGNLYN
ncbi:hypothetical protein [Endozoicomonas euniceicola]|uniref:Cyclodipeptide synthase n=1 Tax=Endozoicomonas euniceicola TaxID=1234143 RepID=A0ABY6GUH3_9GAMM|nr:hypothetical protein [Endozoicomonas euniceicola]UYM16217.1 hypothetical protein NX720_26045 [Endozoicomonas euniceicola]